MGAQRKKRDYQIKYISNCEGECGWIETVAGFTTGERCVLHRMSKLRRFKTVQLCS
jgi:hypothetical protein